MSRLIHRDNHDAFQCELIDNCNGKLARIAKGTMFAIEPDGSVFQLIGFTDGTYARARCSTQIVEDMILDLSAILVEANKIKARAAAAEPAPK